MRLVRRYGCMKDVLDFLDLMCQRMSFQPEGSKPILHSSLNG